MYTVCVFIYIYKYILNKIYILCVARCVPMRVDTREIEREREREKEGGRERREGETDTDTDTVPTLCPISPRPPGSPTSPCGPMLPGGPVKPRGPRGWTSMLIVRAGPDSNLALISRNSWGVGRWCVG